MASNSLNLFTQQDAPQSGIYPIHLPQGLIGFPELTEMELVVNPQQAPFLQLQQTGKEDGISFIVVKPYGLIEDYTVVLADEDMRFLNVSSANEVLLLNIVTLHRQLNNRITVNLIGPVAVNKLTHKGKQVVIENFEHYTAWHVLLESVAVEKSQPQMAQA